MGKQYGKVFGLYFGSRLVVVVADPDMLREIHFSQSALFADREILSDFFTEAVGLPPGLFVSKGEQWRQSRAAMAPAFSAMNLRIVAGNITGVCERLGDAVAAHADSNKSVKIDGLFAEYVTESTLALIFGDACINNSAQDKATLIEACRVLWTTMDENTVALLWLLLSQLPWIAVLLGLALKFSWRGRYFIAMHKTCTKMIQQQAYAPGKNKAIVQLMIGSSVLENGTSRKMTTDEIVTQVITLLMAGFETTSVVLSYTAYQLALNQAVQDRLYDHITAYYKSNPEASLFNAAQEIEYLHMVVQESLRIFPPVVGNVRHTWQGAEVKGVTFPPNTSIYAAVHCIHHNPEYWPQPERFIPERFSPQEKANSKRHECTYMPFGVGSRNCIAARFAMLEVKMMLLQIMRRNKFVPGPDTQVPLETIYRGVLSPKNGLFLRIESR